MGIEERIYEIAPEEVYVPEGRQRQKFDQKEMQKLVQSVAQVGQIQPGVCFINPENRTELIVGERRLRACGYAKVVFKYYLKEQVTDTYLLERIQLEENLVRTDLDWREAVFAKERIHELFEREHGASSIGSRGGHSQADTAAFLGEGSSILSEDLILAKYAASVPEVAAAPNKTTAKKIVKRLIQQHEREVILTEALGADSANALINPKSKAKKVETETKVDKAVVADASTAERALIEFDRRVLLGKMEDRLNEFTNGTVDVVLFDPPWGVEYDMVKKKVYGQKSYKDDKEVFRQDLAGWLSLLYLKMAPASHLYFFFGIVDHEFVYRTLERIGFQVNRQPLIWYKQGSRRTRNPDTWHGRAYEPIAFARKGGKKLARPGSPNVKVTPMPTPTMKDIHPSAKHPDIYEYLLLDSCQPQDVVLDPMSGSGMMGVAAEYLRSRLALDWWMIEADSDYRNLSIFNLTKGRAAIVGETAKPKVGTDGVREPPAPAGGVTDFMLLIPGSDEWTEYWTANPDEQDAMLAWRKEQGGKK